MLYSPLAAPNQIQLISRNDRSVYFVSKYMPFSVLQDHVVMSCHVPPSRARLLATLQQVALHSLRCSAARHSVPSDIPVSLDLVQPTSPGASSTSPAFDHAYHDVFLQLRGSYDMAEVSHLLSDNLSIERCRVCQTAEYELIRCLLWSMGCVTFFTSTTS